MFHPLSAVRILLAPVLAGACAAAILPPAAVAQTAVPTAPPALSFVQPLAPPALRAVQQGLRSQGAYGGAIDGNWGPDSQAALEQFQQSHSLQVTGQMNAATARALNLDLTGLLQIEPGAVAPPPERLSPEAVRSIQNRLRTLGFYNGGVDGAWGAQTRTALTAFQQNRGLQPTGEVNPPTVGALGLDPRDPSRPAP